MSSSAILPVRGSDPAGGTVDLIVEGAILVELKVGIRRCVLDFPSRDTGIDVDRVDGPDVQVITDVRG
jgi:hypothetical protein